MKPGSTPGTRRRLAQGWSGTMAGRYRVAKITQANTISGSAQDGGLAAQAAAGQHGEPQGRPGATAGTPEVPEDPVQAELEQSRPGWIGRLSAFWKMAMTEL